MSDMEKHDSLAQGEGFAEISFEALHKKYYTQMLRYSEHVYRNVRLKNDHFDRFDAEDVVCDAFAELYVCWEEFSPRREGLLLRWLMKTVKQMTYSFHRKQAAQPRKIELLDWIAAGEIGREEDSHEFLFSKSPEEEDIKLANYLQGIQKRLSEEQNRIFECIVLRKYTVAQTAKILLKKENTVRVELYRLRRRLRLKILPEILGPEYVNILKTI